MLRTWPLAFLVALAGCTLFGSDAGDDDDDDDDDDTGNVFAADGDDDDDVNAGPSDGLYGEWEGDTFYDPASGTTFYFPEIGDEPSYYWTLDVGWEETEGSLYIDWVGTLANYFNDGYYDVRVRPSTTEDYRLDIDVEGYISIFDCDVRVDELVCTDQDYGSVITFYRVR